MTQLKRGPGAVSWLAFLALANAACLESNDGEEGVEDSLGSPETTTTEASTGTSHSGGTSSEDTSTSTSTAGGDPPQTTGTSGQSTSSTTAPEDPTTDSGSGSSGGVIVDATCTQVIGYSQVNQWFNEGGIFEGLVGDGGWQLLWNGGAGVDRWREPDYQGWDNSIVSPCDDDADAPQRVLLSVSGPFGADEQAWAEAIEATIEQIHTKLPSVEQIVLQPVVGGPQGMPCQFNGQTVRASWQHNHIDAAIAMVVANDVVVGFSPEVQSCDEYRDATGHLTEPGGAQAAGQSIGDAYASW